MKRHKVLILSEMRWTRGGWAGGFSAITEGLGMALNHLGQDVKVIGIGYAGEEHDLPFSVIPFLDIGFTHIQVRDILEGWWPDDLIVGLDLPQHAPIFANLRSKVKYIGLFPVEGGPVLPDWADLAAQFDGVLTISQFGVDTLKAAGVTAKLVPVGATLGIGRANRSDVPKMLTAAKLAGRYVTLKVADNHSRKNIAHTIEFWTKWAKPDCTLILVTRPDNPLGWHIPELFAQFGGSRIASSDAWEWPDGKQVRLLSNLSRLDLGWVYNLAAYNGHLLMDTGAEGLGIPILEAMWVGLPVIGMDHTAITELLSDGRGRLFKPGYEFIDFFGNARRYYPGYDTWAEAMDELYYDPAKRLAYVMKARTWVEARTWEKAGAAVLEAL